MIDSLKVILFSIIISIFYGICHDLITAHICVEYFTIAHPKVIESENPILLALTWGILATWWVGLILSSFFLIAMKLGNYPVLYFKDIYKQMFKLILIIGALALIGGAIGYILISTKTFSISPHLAERLPNPKTHLPFLVCAWMHGTSYLVGFIGGIILSLKFWRKRKTII